MIRPCGHSDREHNGLCFTVPVYRLREPEEAGILIAPQPDHYLERNYCMECVIQRLDKLMRPPWWRRALNWWRGR